MSISEPAPRYLGLRYVGDTIEDPILSVAVPYSYNGVVFFVLASANHKELPPGYKLDQSIEGKLLIEMNDLSWGEVTDEKDNRIYYLQDELARLVADACLPLMRQLAPSTPLSTPRTLQEELYPETYMLQVLTEGDKLKCHRLDGYELPPKHPPIPEAKLQEIFPEAKLQDIKPNVISPFSITVVKPSQIILGPRLQSLVWKVDVDREEMICKVSLDIFQDAISEELQTYMKIRDAKVGVGMRVPQLKGIIQSHMGVIGILLNYIPHKYHSLRMLLDGVKCGDIPEAEATISMKTKWATQIKETLKQLHELGILWRDIKTDNVLIDDHGDAILLDFGGGNTLGWVDQDKYNTMEGDVQGLQKILTALGEE
ncbi:hypothetical protein F5Y06DRAFT_268381 [Hypoxylon sp. FL0890]|nr:hypothetical protein F5Y06DRAFT_268381 [Hypoxylon sp. FL0890]